MKRLMAVAVGGILSVSLVAAVNAAPATTAPGNPPPRQGMENAKKAARAKQEHDKKVREVRKQGQMKKKQLERGK